MPLTSVDCRTLKVYDSEGNERSYEEFYGEYYPFQWCAVVTHQDGVLVLAGSPTEKGHPEWEDSPFVVDRFIGEEVLPRVISMTMMGSDEEVISYIRMGDEWSQVFEGHVCC